MVNITDAARLLKNGECVAFPTETVYGLGARADSNEAVQSVYKLKNRPQINPLITHVYNIEQVKQEAFVSQAAYNLMQAFWPGPLTLVLPLRESTSLSTHVTAGLKTAAFRMPKHPIALNLLKEVDLPLVGPSANPSSEVSPSSAEHVLKRFPKLPVLAGGETDIGIESTILDLSDEKPTLLRLGAVTQEMIETVLGCSCLKTFHSTKPKAPGMLQRHYAPKVSLRLNALTPLKNEQFLGFGPVSADFNLSSNSSLEEAAKNLYKGLLLLEENNQPIAVSPIPNWGIGLAINDRLKRAATKIRDDKS